MQRETRPQDGKSPRRFPRSPRARIARKRGFTLIEILVALSAGVLVSMAAFSLSKSATAFFQHEARISTAQLAVTLGMNRITQDLARASFLSSPNARADPMVCRDATWAAAAGLNSLAGIQIKAGVATPGSQAAQNGLTPDELVLGGSFDSAEVFTVQCVLSGGAGGPTLQLQDRFHDNAMARVYDSLGAGETLASRLNLMFDGGRFVQLFSPATGYRYYGVLATKPAVTVTGDIATLQLTSTPTIPTKPASPCGMVAAPTCGGGLLVSVVSRVRYEIMSLQGIATSKYAGLVTSPPGVAAITGDAGRTELTRVELDAAGAPIEDKRELISEYAVDLRFGITVAPRITNDNYNLLAGELTTYGFGHTKVYENAGDIAVNAAATPQLIRSVQLRLAARTRAPDRSADLPTGLDGRRLHYLVSNSVVPPYARVRTAYANVALPNQGGFSPW
jgi:prepilin-type N-terminal cleavage/methylation domain-containing protein